MKKIYLHVGLHKTATTFLQTNCFPYIDNNTVEYNPGEILNLLNTCIKFPERKKSLIPLIQEKIDSFTKEKIFISREGLSGNLLDFYKNYKSTILLLNEIFKKYEVQIFLVLREQIDWIQSTYKQSVRLHHYQSLNEYIGFKEQENEEFCLADYRDLNYFNIIKEYIKYFQKSNIHILFYEEFKKDKTKFLYIFEKHLGIKIPIYSENQIIHQGYSEYGTLKVVSLMQKLMKFKLYFLIPNATFLFGENKVRPNFRTAT
jgi:hypothetical protein